MNKATAPGYELGDTKSTNNSEIQNLQYEYIANLKEENLDLRKALREMLHYLKCYYNIANDPLSPAFEKIVAYELELCKKEIKDV